jgi:hypothetical protein
MLINFVFYMSEMGGQKSQANRRKFAHVVKEEPNILVGNSSAQEIIM